MNSSTRSVVRTLAVRTAVAMAAVAACTGASALPSFTFNPAGAGLMGSSFTADNLIISDFATVTGTQTGFSETGYLSITGATLAGANVMSGIGSGYGLYLKFDAIGTNVLAPGGAVQYGNLASLTYTLYGYNGAPFNFSPTSAPTPFVTLGSGSLTSGTFFGTTMGTTVTSATATVNAATFAKSSTSGTFFATPASFYTLAAASFSNDMSTIVTNADGTGFTVNGGGGSLHFTAAAVPEPETYALMLGGLAAVGFVARRRNNG